MIEASLVKHGISAIGTSERARESETSGMSEGSDRLLMLTASFFASSFNHITVEQLAGIRTTTHGKRLMLVHKNEVFCLINKSSLRD